MKTSLDHLPEGKRRELSRVVQLLFAEFEDVVAHRQIARRKMGRILKIVLFGSYARGDWVEDRVSGYRSDYDLLVVVNQDELTDVVEYWAKADEHLLREYETTHALSAPANFIVHSLADVNKQLARGRPFFTDIVRDGVALYQADPEPLGKPRELSADEARVEAKAHFDEWLPSAERRLELGLEAMKRGYSKEAAFDLHQTAERLYHCLLLTLTLYSPKSHKLNFLRSQAERLAPDLIAAWPRGTKFEQRSWELLRRAYVDARYSPHFRITSGELAWLAERIAVLHDRVRLECERVLRVRC
ncbi:HEPN domain-containing protein [Phenylobacterium sp.]|jgi:predicted nucleotidyltransferase/HEPN domain-containing protein|uniref:HEPN domain-containing protein n=1 Tax=Phenylobacterium sp. TaxID=1871053 RepID=UPI002F93D729